MSEFPFANPVRAIPMDLLHVTGPRPQSRAAEAMKAPGGKDREELKKVAEEFEAIFIAQLLKVMRDTIEESGLMEEGFGKSIYTELFDQEVALDMARHGTLGISDMVYRSLSESAGSGEKPNSLPPASSSVGEPGTGATPAAVARETGLLPEIDISELQLPVKAPVSSSFGMRRDPFTGHARFHKGIDLAAPEGAKVVSALPGKVVSVGYEAGYGNNILIEHERGVQTRYGHLATIHVKAGDVVNAEHTIGTVGSTGRSTGPHLHFEVIRGGRVENPMPVLSAAKGQ